MKTMYYIVYRNLDTMVLTKEYTNEARVQEIVNNQRYWVYAIRTGA